MIVAGFALSIAAVAFMSMLRRAFPPKPVYRGRR